MAAQPEAAPETPETQSIPDTRGDLIEYLTTHQLSADLLISAFSSALSHYRRASVATPFPTHLYKTPKGEKDYKSCLSAVERLPAVDKLADSLTKAPPATVELLSWLLLPENRRRHVFTPVSQEAFQQSVAREATPRGSAPDFTVPANVPSAILQVQTRSNEASIFTRPVIAYHGTCMENLHSILNTGLLNFSGTRMGRNGAIFGNGIYLSTRFDVAFSFSKPAHTWRHSKLGSKARCLLVCEVDMAKLEPTSQQASNPANGSANEPASAQQLPESYLLVNRADAIRLLYVLTYDDSRGHGPHAAQSALARVPWSRIVIALYAVWILVQWLVNNKELRRQLKRWWLELGRTDARVPSW